MPAPRPRKVCRWELSNGLRFLRLASDALHQSLLTGVPGVRAVPLARLELQPVCHQRSQGAWDETVLLPSAEVMPLLRHWLEAGGSGVEVPPRTWQEPTMWLEQLGHRPVALQVCPALAPAR